MTANSEQLSIFLTTLDREMASSGTCGESTCVVIILSEDGIIGASVGDSGALIFSKGGIDNLTRNQIRKPLLGSGRAMPIGFKRGQWDGVLLIASDGLLKYTSQAKIAETIANDNLDNLAGKLINLVKCQSGALPDDVSILLVRQN